MEIKHVTFNPNSGGILGMPTHLEITCTSLEKDGWMLLRVIPWTYHESIAIFTKENA